MTAHVAEAVPHLAVIVAEPAALAVTVPPLTVATEELDVDHVTVPEAVAVNVAVLPTVNDNDDLFNETESATVAAVTVTVHSPYLALLNVEVALMVALPTATAVTTPLLLTVATLVFNDDQVTACEAPLETLTVALKFPVVVPFKSRFKDDGVTLTELTVGSLLDEPL